MATLSRIDYFKHGGVLGEYRWPVGLSDFGRLNLIFGWNGSGKTSLSRMLRSLELRENATSFEANLSFGSTRLESDNFSDSKLPIRVFNRHFVDEVVTGSQGAGAPYILVVGPKNAKRQTTLQTLRDRRTDISDADDRAQARSRAAADGMDTWLVTRAALLKESSRKLGGSNRLDNLNKRSYANESKKYIVGQLPPQLQLSVARESELRSITGAKLTARVNPLPTYRAPSITNAETRVAALLHRTALSTVVQLLAADTELEIWAKDGLSIHRRHGATSCLFCEAKLSNTRLAVLEAHFSEAYQALELDIDAEIETLKSQTSVTYVSGLPGEGAVYSDLLADYRSAEAALLAEDARINASLKKLTALLRAKRQAMNTAQTLGTAVANAEGEDSETAVEADPLAKMTTCLASHNERCDKFDETSASAKEELAAAFFCEGLSEFAARESDLGELEAQARECAKALRGLDLAIQALEQDLSDHLRPAAELNNELCAYLGHASVEFIDAGTGYKLKNRDGDAEFLSDGERTAIALLYFLKCLEDDSIKGLEPIVVLDDPISSLDENAIYNAFGFIKQRTRKAGQLIVLTHNYVFFGLVRNWMRQENRRAQNGDIANFYMLERVSEDGGTRTELQELDPLLRDHESDYHYLFSCLALEAASKAPRNYADYYAYPNMARRLLESFLFFKFPSGGELSTKVMSLDYDDASKETVLRFLHGYSHSGGRLDGEQDMSLLAETRAILRTLFDMMRVEDEKHFKRMRKATGAPQIPKPRLSPQR